MPTNVFLENANENEKRLEEHPFTTSTTSNNSNSRQQDRQASQRFVRPLEDISRALHELIDEFVKFPP